MIGTGDGTGQKFAHPACYYRKANDAKDMAVAKLNLRFMAMERLLELADIALRDTGHEPKCEAVRMQLHCTCGSSETFKPKRAEFYKQYTEWKRRK
jgi:hypothetical protein